MDFREKNEQGLTVCPECKKQYPPVLGERPEGDKRPIQFIFPDATIEQREQLISGLCSNRCWKEHLEGKKHEREIRP